MIPTEKLYVACHWIFSVSNLPSVTYCVLCLFLDNTIPLNNFSLLFEFVPMFDVFYSSEFKVSRAFAFVIDNSVSQTATTFCSLFMPMIWHF